MLEQAARNNFGRAAEIDGLSTSACTALAMAAKLALNSMNIIFSFTAETAL